MSHKGLKKSVKCRDVKSAQDQIAELVTDAGPDIRKSTGLSLSKQISLLNDQSKETAKRLHQAEEAKQAVRDN